MGFLEQPRLFEMRPVEENAWPLGTPAHPLRYVEMSEQPLERKPSTMVWVRLHGDLSDDKDPTLQAATLALMSDWFTAKAVMVAVGSREISERLNMAVALDHSMWFHDLPAAHTNDWLLFETGLVKFTRGRALTFGKVWTRAGQLVLSFSMEGLFRL